MTLCLPRMIHHLLRGSHTDNRRLETLCKTWNKIYREGIVIQAWTSRVCLMSVYRGWSLRAVVFGRKGRILWVRVVGSWVRERRWLVNGGY